MRMKSRTPLQRWEENTMPGEQDNRADSLPFIGPDGVTQKPTAEPQDSLAADAMDRLAKNDRVQVESRMLPQTKLTDEQVIDVRARVKAYMQRSASHRRPRFQGNQLLQSRSLGMAGGEVRRRQ